MRTMKQVASTAEPARFDPSTWAQQARLLARNEADAWALRGGLALAGVVILGIVAVVVLDVRLPRDLAPLLAAVAGGLALVALLWGWTYSNALSRNTRHVREATWQMEVERGEDLDGDGRLGAPPVGHVVKIGGRRPASVVLPDLDAPRSAAPLARFPVPPNDVVYVLTRAAREGLGFREWDGHRLPSGAEVDRPLWTRVIDGMVDWEMVQATTDAAGRRRVRLAGDATVDEMISAVRRSVAGEKP